jgi:hypothetical protein
VVGGLVVVGVVVLLVGGLTLATAQSNTRLRGEVTYQDGTPAGNTAVEIVDLDDGTVNETVTTRGDGTFGPFPYEPGNYTARVNRSDVQSFGTQVTLESGESEKIEVSLDKVTGELRGAATDDDGRPVGDLDLRIRNVDDGTVAETTTRSDGSYGPIEVPANTTYRIVVDDSGWSGQSSTVALQKDATEYLDVSVERTVGNVTVAAVDGDDEPIENASVEIVDADLGTVEATRETAADGTTDPVELEPGEYTARLDNESRVSTADTVTLSVGESLTINLSATSATGRVSGTVTDASGEPVSGATVEVTNTSTGVRLASATTTESGEWGPTGIDAGRVTVRASAPGYRPANSTVTVSGGELTTVPLTLEASGGVRIQSTDTDRSDGTLSATVTLVNDGGVEQEDIVELRVDGATRTERTVFVPADGTKAVTLTAELVASDGPYEVTVAAGGQTVTTTVGGGATPTATTTTDNRTATETSDGDGAGFGALAAVVAIATVLAGIAGNRRD